MKRVLTSFVFIKATVSFGPTKNLSDLLAASKKNSSEKKVIFKIDKLINMRCMLLKT